MAAGIWLNRLLAEINVEKEPSNPVTLLRTINQQFVCLRTHSFMDAAHIDVNTSSETRLKEEP